MEFCVLGPLEVRDSDRPVAIGGGRRRALLALLLLHPNEVIPAEQLIDELWEGRPPRTAAKGLQVHVSHLRKELSLGAHDNENGAALLTRSTGYVLQVDPETIDAVRFEHALADAGRAREEGRTKQAAALLREGLALWRGPPLVDFAYEVFARDEIARLEELHLLALEDRIDADFALGHHREVLAELEQLVAAHPSRERVRGLLMLGLHRSGRRPDALDVYHEGRERSIAELGLELGEDLRSLQEGILADDHALAAPPHGPGPTQRRPALVISVGALLLACAAGAAFLLDDRERLIVDRPVVDVAVNAVAGVRSDGRPAFALPLPGRPTAIAAHGDQVYAVSVDASALTIADARTRRIVRTVPLVMRPAAVAARGNAVWIADARRGLAVRFRVGHAWVAARATWRRRPPIRPSRRADSTGHRLRSRRTTPG
jgi:DNA-binding SARP family transcriptional activator